MKTLYSAIALILFSSTLFAQEPTGTWYGTLNIQGTSLPLIFHITKAGNEYTTTMDSPQQGAKGMPSSKTTYTSKTLTVEASNIGMKYTGIYAPDSNKISGTFEQGPIRTALVLSSKPEKASAVQQIRPQDPKDFPYKQEEVTFTNTVGGNSLAGTLTLPINGKASKIVILITGSGPQDRNEELAPFNHRPFLVLSDHLTRQGIAVLRYDDRGVGKSTGIFSAATTADFADDAEAAVKYILSRPDLKNMTIGLVGHSEGGMIAPIVASRNPNVKFIVLMAGPGVPITQLCARQIGDALKLAGVPADEVAHKTASNLKIFTVMNEVKDLPLPNAEVEVELALRKELDLEPLEKLNRTAKESIVQQTLNKYKTPWFRYFISFDPAIYLTKVKCPVLALNGTLDFQVESTANLAGIKTGLQKAGNKRFEIVPMEGLNHLFQKANTGAESEYGNIEETLNPAALQKISSWINGI
ncbi:MAG: alpha/beta fold hydrolase [Candidatus Pedobacter colombiensis]|uniref:Alpha/beta fold hydrolase n=1 Tax=Candidatus Pedobacter colombiensis TaxID=3121371 RepID=A0AAJ6B6G2_9SPHI|nr:alpha/beta fold hydrolase [Pedobacter sp.]WEK19907.1 MAG: alpha/beta fold hydrolase [Pedobacter sp.]